MARLQDHAVTGKLGAVNRLGDETSPYLLQHAGNPVHWQPWTPEALDQARREDRPILLSIGYSACHWCHVMAHESFEDKETAALMNRLFINIKVDREERPDLDQVYQRAHQLMLQRPGGWPLTMFLDPDSLRPFFGGTYFPVRARQGMPAFGDVLERVAQYFDSHRDEIRGGGDALIEALQSLEPGPPAGADSLAGSSLDAAREAIAGQMDREFGGLGTAPKFPHPDCLDRLLRHWRGTAHGDQPDLDALFLCSLTLRRMAEGGIYDQLGGGFSRYSVDREWNIPHFEKMLYDNGPLLALYARLWQISGDELYRTVANETADWAIRDMRAPGGGFFSALDADSEGEEGRFYVWTPNQARALLNEDEYQAIAARFGLDGPPNFEGHWHLRVCREVDDIASSVGSNPSAVRRLLNSGRSRMLAAREGRDWPGRDEKILTAWNALMIRGLAIAGRVLRRPDLISSAQRALEFIRVQLVRDDRLRACFKDDRARFNAYLDDHAFLLDACIEVLQAQWDPVQISFATWLAGQLLEHFEDRENGGFFFTAHDQEALIHRPKPMPDDATPSGNGIAALALNRLGHMLGETRYIEAAARTLRAGWTAIERYPGGHASLVTALEEYLHPPTVVILRGEAGEIAAWAESLDAHYAPRRIVLAIPSGEADLPGALAARKPAAGPVAYVCDGSACGPPLDSLEALAAELSEA